MGSVLLLEDDLVDALAIKRAFKEFEVTNIIHHFTNGADAIAFIREQEELIPALLLVDLNMPKMGGVEFLENLRREKPEYDTPVIILTTSNEKQDRKLSEQFEVYNYLVKPVNYNDYKSLIQSFLHLLDSST